MPNICIFKKKFILIYEYMYMATCILLRIRKTYFCFIFQSLWPGGLWKSSCNTRNKRTISVHHKVFLYLVKTFFFTCIKISCVLWTLVSLLMIEHAPKIWIMKMWGESFYYKWRRKTGVQIVMHVHVKLNINLFHKRFGVN